MVVFTIYSVTSASLPYWKTFLVNTVKYMPRDKENLTL